MPLGPLLRIVRPSSRLAAGCLGTLTLICPCLRAQLPDAPSPASLASASLAGLVTDRDGIPIAGAQVLLTRVAAAETAQAPAAPPLLLHTGDEGTFMASSLMAGSYQIVVTLSGFVPVTRGVTLLQGQSLQLEPLPLALDTVAITVDAGMPEQIAAIELHEEEKQRLLGVLPNFFVSYRWQAYPLTARQKYELATRTAFDPANLALAGTVAGVQQAANAFPGYHQGAAGYGKRLGADLANLVVGTYLGGAVLPSLFHQDPRYFYKGTGTLRQRFFYAVSRSVVTRGDNGHQQFNVSGVLGDLSAGAVSNIYYPASDRQGAHVFLVNGLLAIAGDAMNGFVQEFVLPRFTTKKPSPGAPSTGP